MGTRAGMGTVAPPELAHLNLEEEEKWRRFDNSVNAVSFGFVATAILISMFLVMAIFERFLRPRHSFPSTPSGTHIMVDSPIALRLKPDFPSNSKTRIYSKEVSVLMPGEEMPTFIAQPAPCPPERVLRPIHPDKLSP